MRPLKALISKNTLHRAHTDVLVEINNFTFKDVITPGNIVLISSDGYYCEHHGIVLNKEQCYGFFQTNDQHTICTLNEYGTLTRWNTGNLKETFPFLANSDAKILKVYRKTKYTENIDTIHDIQDVYKKYNLLTILCIKNIIC